MRCLRCAPCPKKPCPNEAESDDVVSEHGSLFTRARRAVRPDAAHARSVGPERDARWRAERARWRTCSPATIQDRRGSSRGSRSSCSGRCRSRRCRSWRARSGPARRCSGSKARCSPTASKSCARSRCEFGPRPSMWATSCRLRSTCRRRPSEGAPPAFQFFDREHVGYWNANEIRLVRGGFGVAGPATAWLRLRCPVVDDEPVAPFERVAAVADFGSGIGNPLTFESRQRDQSGSHDPRAPPPGRRMGVPRFRRMGRCRRRRPRRQSLVRRARAARSRVRRRCSSHRSATRRRGLRSRRSSAFSVLATRGRRRRRGARTRRCGTRCSRAGRRAVAASRPGCGRRAPRSCGGRPR